jgi:hypothetical protein
MQIRTINVSRMTRAQLDRLYAESQTITPQTPSHKLDVQDRALHRRAGRPRIGAGARRINVTIEQTLLAKVDAYARKRGMTRASLVAAGLQKVLAA